MARAGQPTFRPGRALIAVIVASLLLSDGALEHRFGEATGVRVILYTSAEAYHTFERSGMDMLVLGNHIVEKSPARPR